MINHVLKSSSIKWLYILVLASSAWACGNEILIDRNVEFKDEFWKVDDKFYTTFSAEDTVSNYNFFVTLRNTDEYQYQNLFVFLKTEFPNGKSKLDTINCPLANAQGKWLGKGFGGVYDNRILYIARKRFPLQGEYSITIEQAMRDEELKGILDVGVRIEKAP